MIKTGEYSNRYGKMKKHRCLESRNCIEVALIKHVGEYYSNYGT